MKGQVSYPFSMFEAAFTFLLLMSVIYGAQSYTENFMKEETADAQADRVKNAAMALDSLDTGYIELPITGYNYRIDDDKLDLQFREAEQSVEILGSLSVDRLNGSEEFTELSGLCLEKKNIGSDTVIDFTSGDC